MRKSLNKVHQALDAMDEAERVFGQRFAETLQVAARGVQIRVKLPPYFNVQRFYGEVYSADPQRVKPQHLGMDDSMVLFQILRACDPELPREDDGIAVDVTWQDPATGIARQRSLNTTLGALDVADPRLHKAAAVVAFAEALRALEGLDERGRVAALAVARQELRAVDPALADPDLAELDDLVGRLLVSNGHPAAEEL